MSIERASASRGRIEGVVPILVTPFDEKGRLDTEGLGRLIEFNISAGVHGLGLAIGSEMFKLNEEERDRLVVATVGAVGGRVPVIVNTGAAGTDLAIHYSKAAEDAGASALMIIPPTFLPAGPDQIIDYYTRIARAVALPIVLQDVPQAPISPGLAMRIAETCSNVEYIKVETLPVTAKVAEMTAAAGARLTVFGGAGGGYFIEEMRRGARGTMPFASQPAEFVRVWELFQAGDVAGARTEFEATIMPVNHVAFQSADVFYHVHKQLLVRRGILSGATVRSPTMEVDPITQREIDELLDRMVLLAS